MQNKWGGNRSCFVKIFIGFTTAGEPLFEHKCICPACLGNTAPIHSYTESLDEVDEDEHSES
jgi:hypothetical protein